MQGAWSAAQRTTTDTASIFLHRCAFGDGFAG